MNGRDGASCHQGLQIQFCPTQGQLVDCCIFCMGAAGAFCGVSEYCRSAPVMALRLRSLRSSASRSSAACVCRRYCATCMYISEGWQVSPLIRISDANAARLDVSPVRKDVAKAMHTSSPISAGVCASAGQVARASTAADSLATRWLIRLLLYVGDFGHLYL